MLWGFANNNVPHVPDMLHMNAVYTFTWLSSFAIFVYICCLFVFYNLVYMQITSSPHIADTAHEPTELPDVRKYSLVGGFFINRSIKGSINLEIEIY